MNKDLLIGLILLGVGISLYLNRNALLTEKDKEQFRRLVSPKARARQKEEIKANQKQQTRQWLVPEEGLEFLPAFERASYVFNLPENLLARVAYEESRFRPEIISGQRVSIKGAQGIMQIIPKWHPEVNPLDTDDAIYYAGKYLRKLYNQFGTWDLALAAYNWGPGNLANLGIQKAPLETKNYVNAIMGDIING